MQTIKRHELSKWDDRFLLLAEHIAGWSKGPRKRVGAVIVREDRTIASTGYNGPEPGFDDELFLQMPREEQHEVVIHAEANALDFLPPWHCDACGHMNRSETELTLYVSPLYPCEDCASRIANDGFIRRVVAYCGHISPDWLASAEAGYAKLIAAGIEVVYVEGEPDDA